MTLDEITFERAQAMGEPDVRNALARVIVLNGWLQARLVMLETRPKLEPPDTFLTIAEAARELRMSPTELYRHKRRYPFLIRNGGKWLASRNGIKQWSRNGGTDASERPGA